MRHNDRNIIIIFVNFKKVIIVRNDKICSLCADGKIRNRNFLTWQTILPSPLSLWLLGYHLRCNGMEWNGNGYGTRIGHYGLDWALGSGGSMMTDDDDVSPYFLPTDTLVRSSVLTHVLYRVLHGSPPSWWWWWMTVCGGDRLMRRLLDVDTPTSLLLGHNGISRSILQRQRWPTTWPTYVWWPLTTRNLSTCEPQRLRLLWSNQLVNRRSTYRWGNWFSVGALRHETEHTGTDRRTDQCDPDQPNGALHTTDWVLCWHAPLIPIPPAHM